MKRILLTICVVILGVFFLSANTAEAQWYPYYYPYYGYYGYGQGGYQAAAIISASAQGFYSIYGTIKALQIQQEQIRIQQEQIQLEREKLERAKYYPPATPVAPAAVPAATGRVVIVNGGTAGELFVNGESKGGFQAREIKGFDLQLGTHSFILRTEKKVLEKTATVRPSETVVVTFDP